MAKQPMNKRTKQCRARAIFFGILHFLLFCGPLLFFVPFAFIGAEVVSKIALSLSLTSSLILLLISFIVGVKHKAGMHRSIIWILIAGVMLCLSNVTTFIWVMAGTSILDELLVSKLYEHYKVSYATNREIDMRGN